MEEHPLAHRITLAGPLCSLTRVRIRFLLHDIYSQAGGVVTVTFALAEELAKRHDVELVSTFASGTPAVHPLPAGVRIRNLIEPERRSRGVRRRLRAWAESRPSRVIPTAERRYHYYSAYTDLVLLRYLRSQRGGVLVTMQPGLNIASARLGTRRYVRVAQDHRPYQGRPGGLLDAYRRYAGRLDLFLTLTRADAKRFRKMLGGEVPVRAIGNGTPHYGGPASTHTEQTVMAAGRLARTKGFDVLIDAWARVDAKHPDWQLEIWGEGGLRGELARQAADLGLSEKVHLRGFSNRLQAELPRASIFALSSRAEGYPRVILEAEACAVPVVSTNCPAGPREMIESGVDGILVPNEDAEALAEAVIDLIERGPEGRRAMGEAGRARAEALSQPVVAQRWERMLSELVEHRQLS
jgi:glycosyltransferase involved in cell wall biosynthesis